jgi:hypothetical protein
MSLCAFDRNEMTRARALFDSEGHNGDPAARNALPTEDAWDQLYNRKMYRKVTAPEYAPELGGFSIKPSYPLHVCEFDPEQAHGMYNWTKLPDVSGISEAEKGWQRPAVQGGYACTRPYEACLWVGRPIQPVGDFTDFYNSVVVVFLVLYREGYQSVWSQLRDAWVPLAGVFYVLGLLVLGSFYFLNLFVAIVVENYVIVFKECVSEREDALALRKRSADWKEEKPVEQPHAHSIFRMYLFFHKKAHISTRFGLRDLCGKVVHFPRLELNSLDRFSYFDKVRLRTLVPLNEWA